jgi:hypothetical protein
MDEKELSLPGDYDIEKWIMRLGSMPKKTIALRDDSGSYEMHRAWILQLENGQFAVVTESGCSCYDSSQAEIDLHKDLELAKEQFERFFI